MKLTQRQAIELTEHLLQRLMESTHKTTALENIESALVATSRIKNLMNDGDGFYDCVLFRNENTLVEVDLERQHKVG